MNKIYFCKVCRAVFTEGQECTCQEINGIQEVKKGTPMNIIGTKIKGKVIRIKENAVDLLVRKENNKIIRTCKVGEVRKIL